jgi:WD40 repeat protein
MSTEPSTLDLASAANCVAGAQAPATRSRRLPRPWKRPKRWVVVSAGAKAVRVSELPSLNLVRGWIANQIWVRAVAICSRGTRELVISAGRDSSMGGHVRVVDLFSGDPYRDAIYHEDWVACVALTRLGDKDVVVGGMSDGSIRLWDLATRARIGEPMAHATDPDPLLLGPMASHLGLFAVTALASAQTEGGPLLVSGGADGTLCLWDLATQTPIGERVEVHEGGVSALAATRDPDVALLASGGEDGKLRTYYFETLRPTPSGAPVEAYSGRVSALAIAELRHAEVLVSGGADGQVRFWSLRTLKPLGAVSAHEGGVSALATAAAPDAPVVVSGGADGNLRVWDIATESPRSEAVDAHAGEVSAIAVAELDWVWGSVLAAARSLLRPLSRAASNPLRLVLGGIAVAVAAGAVVAVALLSAHGQTPSAAARSGSGTVGAVTPHRTTIAVLYLLSFVASAGGVTCIFLDLTRLLRRQREYRSRLERLNPRVPLEDLRSKFFEAPDRSDPAVLAALVQSLEARVSQLEVSAEQAGLVRDQVMQELEEQGRRVDENASNMQLVAELTEVDQRPVIALVGAGLVAVGLTLGFAATLVWLYS